MMPFFPSLHLLTCLVCLAVMYGESKKDVLRKKNCAAAGDAWTWAKLFFGVGGKKKGRTEKVASP